MKGAADAERGTGIAGGHLRIANTGVTNMEVAGAGGQEAGINRPGIGLGAAGAVVAEVPHSVTESTRVLRRPN